MMNKHTLNRKIVINIYRNYIDTIIHNIQYDTQNMNQLS